MTLKQYIYLISLLVLGNLSLQAQDTIQLSNIITGKLEVVAKKQVVLNDGFIAMEGSNVIIYTDESADESTSISIPTLGAQDDATNPISNVSDDQNYIRAITLFEKNSSTYLSDDHLAYIKHAEDIQYFDGLGRLRQTVQVAASPKGYDIIQPTVYDEYGRIPLQFLPYVSTSSDGSFEKGDDGKCALYYGKSNNNIEGRVLDLRPYATTEFDNSPLNRVVGQYGVGTDWYKNEKSVTTNYTTNTSEVKNWDENGDAADPYAIGTLYVTEVTDEEGTITREYKDKQGQVVLKESETEKETLRTYYAYDDFGLLRVVIPPLATSGTDTDLCYYYTYDKRHRMITKKIPGAKIVYMVYDSRDRLVLTQDCEMREHKIPEYLFTKYDELNRPVMTGRFYSSDDIDKIREDAEAASSSETFSDDNGCYGYTTNGSFPEIDMGDVLTVTWYDDYDYLGLKSPEDIANCSFDNYSTLDETYGAAYSSMTKGMVTGSLVKVLPYSTTLDYDVTDTVPVTALYYDDYGNVIRSVASNYRGGYDVTLTNYEDITYRVESSCEVHKSSNEDSSPLAVTKKYSYDYMGRLLQTTSQVDNGDGVEDVGESEIVLNAMQYNELGELVAKYLYGENTDLSADDREFVQRVDYDYNIRGWLTAINDPSLSEDNDVFGLKLYYNDGADVSAESQYNGNISAMSWATSEDTEISGYTFEYDGFNRLNTANYGTGSSIESNGDGYNVSIPTYDANGNIIALSRYYNNTLIDNLTYTYKDKSNQLQSVSDEASHLEYVPDFKDVNKDDSYGYDSNGNMIFDASRGNDITYNILNLPKMVSIAGKEDYGIYYLYDAAGTKLAKIVEDGTDKDLQVTEYLGSLVYHDYDLSFIQTEEGRLMNLRDEDVDKNYWHYEFDLKDHLGNNRFVFGGSLNEGRVEKIQVASYYPFGMIMNHENFSTSSINYRKNKYLYNGKEYQDDDLDGHSLNLYDYGARFYDPALGRWQVIDNKAEKYYSCSPYVYSVNNPIRFIDPDGNDWWDIVKGAVAAVTDNAAGGMTDRRETTSYIDPSDYNLGQDIGDGISILLGSLETAAGVIITGGGTAATIASGGTATPVSVPVAIEGVAITAHGATMTGAATANAMNQKGRVDESSGNSSSSNSSGSRRKNRLPDKGNPNTMETNSSGTTTKKYGPDGNVQKEYNKGHQGTNTPDVEKGDHVHDYKPNPYHPEGKGTRQPGRPPKKNEYSKDLYKTNGTN